MTEEETVSCLWMNLRGKKNEKKINGFQMNIVSEWTVRVQVIYVCVCVSGHHCQCVSVWVSGHQIHGQCVCVCVCARVCACGNELQKAHSD